MKRLASTAALDRVWFVWGILPPRRGGQPLHLIYQRKPSLLAPWKLTLTPEEALAELRAEM